MPMWGWDKPLPYDSIPYRQEREARAAALNHPNIRDEPRCQELKRRTLGLEDG